MQIKRLGDPQLSVWNFFDLLGFWASSGGPVGWMEWGDDTNQKVCQKSVKNSWKLSNFANFWRAVKSQQCHWACADHLYFLLEKI